MSEDSDDRSVPAATATKQDIESLLATPPAKGGGKGEEKEGPSSSRQAWEWVGIAAGAIVVAIIVRAVLFQAFFIPSGSMENTLKINDRVLVNKLAYKFHKIHRGDIVVFKRPPTESGPIEIKDLIKRVIGLPGETIESHDGQVFIDGKPLVEPYTNGVAVGRIPIKKQTLGPNKIFVMGDNRDNSSDSRVFQPIDESLVVGRAFVKVWPLGSIEWL